MPSLRFKRRKPERVVKLYDEADLVLGGVAYFQYNTDDANANCLVVDLPSGGVIDVPVVAFGIDIAETDLGLFNGLTQTTVAIVDANKDSYLKLDFSADDVARLTVGGGCTELGIAATNINLTGIVDITGAITLDAITSVGDLSVDGALALIDGSTSVRLVSAGFVSLESPANRFGLNATEYMQITTAVTTGVTSITHTGTDPIITWTANGFEFVGDVVITSVLKGLDIDVTSAGADANYFGIDNDVIQGAVAGGAYLSRGNLIGAANSVSAIGNIDATYGTYSPSYLVMAADTEANQLYGGIFMSNVEGPFTLDIHDGVVGAQLTLEIAADVVDVTRGAGTGIVAGAFIWANVLKAITAPVYGAYIKCTNHCDYGQTIAVESNNISAGMQILTKDSAVLPIGLQIISVSGSITHAFGFSAAGTAPVVASATGAGDAAEGSIAIDVDGSTKYLQYFAATA